MAKILIIKTGYSETFDNGQWQRVSSLGDVLRTTTLLHLYKNKGDNVTWLTDERAVPLLESNPYINRILIWDAITLIQLQHEYFDIVINLERVPGLAALADNIEHKISYGFHFNKDTGEILGKGSPILKRKSISIDWQYSLFSIVGKEYCGEEYILGYKPINWKGESSLIGLNNIVGSKWPTKTWPNKNWFTIINDISKRGLKYSLQPSQTNLYDYIDWINSCKVIVTCDSLGLHIAKALKKKIVALFGPTPVFEELLSKDVIVLRSSSCGDCRHSICNNKEKDICMESISSDQVINAIDNLLQKEEE